MKFNLIKVTYLTIFWLIHGSDAVRKFRRIGNVTCHSETLSWIYFEPYASLLIPDEAFDGSISPVFNATVFYACYSNVTLSGLQQDSEDEKFARRLRKVKGWANEIWKENSFLDCKASSFGSGLSLPGVVKREIVF